MWDTWYAAIGNEELSLRSLIISKYGKPGFTYCTHYDKVSIIWRAVQVIRTKAILSTNQKNVCSLGLIFTGLNKSFSIVCGVHLITVTHTSQRKCSSEFSDKELKRSHGEVNFQECSTFSCHQIEDLSLMLLWKDHKRNLHTCITI